VDFVLLFVDSFL